MTDKKQIDPWLREQIKTAIKTIDEVKDGKWGNKWVNYYTGHLQKDILDNYPGRTSKKIFNMFRQHLNFPNLVFTQKKFDKHGYDYMVKLHYGRLN